MHLKPRNEPKVHFCGRTDAGVHATAATAVIDLQKTEEGDIYYSPRAITLRLNSEFEKANLPIK